MKRYEGLPFKVDERFRGSKRLGDLYLAEEHKPDRARIITNIANIVGPDGYRGNLELHYNHFKEHPRTGGRVGQCIGGEMLRRGNNVSFRTRKVEGDLEQRIGYKKGAWVGDDHYAFLIKLQAALNCDDGEWKKFVRQDSQPKGGYRKKSDHEAEKYEKRMLEDGIETKPGIWVFNALDSIRGKIKDPNVAEAVALYHTYPADLEGPAIERAVNYYLQFYPQKAIGFQSIDNIKYLAEELGEIEVSEKFAPVRIYNYTDDAAKKAKVNTMRKPIAGALDGEITVAQVRGLLRAVREQLGMSVKEKQRKYNRDTIQRYFGELGEQPWMPYKESVALLRNAVGEDKPIVRARLAHDEKAQKELPKRTRLGENYRKSVHFLELIDKGLGGGKDTEWQATLDLVPMRLAQPYVAAAFTVIQQERMKHA